MSTLKEREENNKKLKHIAKEAAGNDLEALEYLNLLAHCARVADDVFDEFENITQLDFLTAIEILFVRMPTNKFYLAHQETLLSQHITMWNAWEASNFLMDGDKTDKIYAHVLRDYINEILPLVALLTQGHDKMKAVNSLIRFLFKKEIGE